MYEHRSNQGADTSDAGSLAAGRSKRPGAAGVKGVEGDGRNAPPPKKRRSTTAAAAAAAATSPYLSAPSVEDVASLLASARVLDKGTLTTRRDALVNGAVPPDPRTCKCVFEGIPQIGVDAETSAAREVLVARAMLAAQRSSQGSAAVAEYTHQQTVGVWEQHPANMGCALAKVSRQQHPVPASSPQHWLVLGLGAETSST